MSMEMIKIVVQKIEMGFKKSTTTHLDGIVFNNGKIAYVDDNGDIRAENDKEMLIKTLKQDIGCVDAHIIYNHNDYSNCKG